MNTHTQTHTHMHIHMHTHIHTHTRTHTHTHTHHTTYTHSLSHTHTHIHTHYSAIAVGYNAAQAFFGGTAGIVGTLLFRSTGGVFSIITHHSHVCAMTQSYVQLE